MADWGDGARLYCGIAGVLSGFVLLFIQMFLSREKGVERAGETDNILLLLSSILFSMVGGAVLFARAVVHAPHSMGEMVPAGMQTFRTIGLMAIVPFNVGCVELTLCLGHLFLAYRVDAQAIRFVNHFLAVLVVIGSVDYANATDISLRLRANPHLTHPGLHFAVTLSAIVFPCLLVREVGRRRGLRIAWVAYATLSVGTFAALFSTVLESGAKLPLLVYVTLGYLLSACLGALYGACLACRPRINRYNPHSVREDG